MTEQLATLGPFALEVEDGLVDPPRVWIGPMIAQSIPVLMDRHGTWKDGGRVRWRKVAVAVRTGATRMHGITLRLPSWFPWPRPDPPRFEPRPSTDPE